MKSKSKMCIAVVLCCILTCTSVYATVQSSTCTLSSGSISAKGNNVNGGYGKISGALNVEGGKVQISIYKVYAMWPDAEIESFLTSHTLLGYKDPVKLENYENLFYSKITRMSGTPSAWAELRTVPSEGDLTN